MATYKITDLHNIICDLINDGYEYADVCPYEADDDAPEGLSFAAIESSDGEVCYEEIDSCELPTGYYVGMDSEKPIKATDLCTKLNFTYDEIFSIKCAIDNALEYAKKICEDRSLPPDTIKEVKRSSIAWRNLQAKFAHSLK